MQVEVKVSLRGLDVHDFASGQPVNMRRITTTASVPVAFAPTQDTVYFPALLS